MNITSPIAVIGAGSWGTALAIHLARNGQAVKIWGNEPEVLTAMQTDRRNQRYIPDIELPPNLTACFEVTEVLQDVDDVLMVVPSHVFAEVLQQLKPYLSNTSRLIIASKGLAVRTGRFLHEVAHEVVGDIPIAFLSGPSFAQEVAQGVPTAVTIATTNDEFAQHLMQRFNSDVFRLYATHDLTGVQIGGAVKNVLAIATGIADGMGFGANTRCALITRGLAEMTQLGLALGAQEHTFLGLSGVGDTILTCTDDQSRNRRFGLALGRGDDPEVAKAAIGQVVEGARNAEEVQRLAQKHKVEMPVINMVYSIIYQNTPVKDALATAFVQSVFME